MSVNVSIIMPVLNGMPYFQEALNSVRNQSMKNIEIIIVDCGSIDGTREYIKETMLVDARVKIIETDVKSMGHQYNLGIMNATGEYIGFCESDDIMDKGAIEYLYLIANDKKADCVKSDFEMFINNPRAFNIKYKILPRNKFDLYEKTITVDDIPALIFRDVNMWNGIYKRSFVLDNNIFLNETPGAAFQDTGFVQRVLAYSKSIVYGTKTVYYYRRDNVSSSVYNATVGKFSMQELLYSFKLLEVNEEFKTKYYKEVFKRGFGMFSAMYSKDLYFGTDIKYKDQIEEFRDVVVEYYNKLTDSQKSSLYDDSWLLLFLNDFENYKNTIRNNYAAVTMRFEKFWDIVRKQKKIIIFGCGENGQSIAANLMNNDFAGEIYFCDNKISNKTEICGIDSYSVEEITTLFPNEMYVITGITFFGEMKKQLMSLKIDSNNIICAPMISMHASMEIKY